MPIKFTNHSTQFGMRPAPAEQAKPEPQAHQPSANSPLPKHSPRLGAGSFYKFIKKVVKGGTTRVQTGKTSGHAPAPDENQWHRADLRQPHARIHVHADPHGMTGPVGQSYTPFKPKIYSDYGMQNQVRVSGTNYARHAVDMLIGPDGKLDRTHISHMLRDLAREDALPAHRQTLSVHHRHHLKKTLERLQHDHRLASTINSTCARAPLRGPAADLVRTTLNLPPEHAHLSPADARKAVVMSLLGNLRQGKVGSCFATSTSICLHEDSPGVVASDLKQLLENNYITFKHNGGTMQVPLNQRTSRAEAQIPLNVKANGTCHGKTPTGQAGPSYRLHETPGMQAALNSMGIPEQQHEAWVRYALAQMGVRGGGTYSISNQQIIETLAHHVQGPTTTKKRIATALNAFSGAEDVRLMRAWEYTVATHAESHNNNEAVQKIGAAILYGKPIPGAPHLPSMALVNGTYQQQLMAHPYYRNAGTPTSEIGQKLFNDVEALMKKRLFLQYDADLQQSGISADGVSERGGFVLYDRTPRNDPSKWQRIDNPAMFQAAMADVVAQASRNTSDKIKRMWRGNPQVNQHALSAMTDNLKQHIGGPAFVDQAAIRFQSPDGHARPVDAFNLPWKQARGAWPAAIIDHYGGKMFRSEWIQAGTPSAPQNHGYGAAGAGDSTHIMKFIFGSMNKMVPEMHAKAQASGGEFKIPLGNSAHVFSLMPMQMKEAWQSGMTQERWLEQSIKQPARQHVQNLRNAPPLFSVVQQLGRQLNMNSNDVNRMYQNIAQSAGGFRRGQQAYSLAAVQQELKTYCQFRRNPQLQARGEEVLGTMAPMPARIFADTNWVDDKGNPVFMGVTYNPFSDKVETQLMDKDHGNRQPVASTWITGQWYMSTPLKSHAAPSP